MREPELLRRQPGEANRVSHVLGNAATCWTFTVSGAHLLLHTHHVGLDPLSVSRSSLVNILASLI